MCKESPLGTLCTSNFKWFRQSVSELLWLEVGLHFGWVLLTLYLPLKNHVSCSVARGRGLRPLYWVNYRVPHQDWAGEARTFPYSQYFGQENKNTGRKMAFLKDFPNQTKFGGFVRIEYHIFRSRSQFAITDIGYGSGRTPSHSPNPKLDFWFFFTTQISVHSTVGPAESANFGPIMYIGRAKCKTRV